MSADESDHRPTHASTFARYVIAHFLSQGNATDAEVAAAGGPSDSYMTQLRNAAFHGGELPKPRRHTQKRIEAAAGWEHGETLKAWAFTDPERAVGGGDEDAAYVAAPGPRTEPAHDDDVLSAIREMRDAIVHMSERLERLEERRS